MRVQYSKKIHFFISCLSVLLIQFASHPAQAQTHRDVINGPFRALTVAIQSEENGFGLIVESNEQSIIVVTAKHLLPEPGGEDTVGIATFTGSSDVEVPLRRIPELETDSDFVFLIGARPERSLPLACTQSSDATIPGSAAWLIASPSSADNPWQASDVTGQIKSLYNNSFFTFESLGNTMVSGASGGPVVGDAGVFGIASEAGAGQGFAVPIWDIVTTGRKAGLEFNHLRACQRPLPPRETAFECLGAQAPTCFADLALQTAASNPQDSLYSLVSTLSAQMLSADAALHAARSIGQKESRAAQLAEISWIFANNGQMSRAKGAREEVVIEFGESSKELISAFTKFRLFSLDGTGFDDRALATLGSAIGTLSLNEQFLARAEIAMLSIAYGYDSLAHEQFSRMTSIAAVLERCDGWQDFAFELRDIAKDLVQSHALQLNVDEALKIVNQFKAHCEPWMESYTFVRVAEGVTEAYCARDGVTIANCMRVLELAHTNANDWLYSTPPKIKGVVETYNGQRNALAVSEALVGLMKARLAELGPDHDDLRWIRYQTADTLARLGEVLNAEKWYVNDPVAERARMSASMWREALQVLQGKPPGDSINTDQLQKIVRGQLIAGFAQDAAGSAAELLDGLIDDEVKTALMNDAIKEIVWDGVTARIPSVDAALDSENALLIGVEVPMAVAEFAFQSGDRTLGEEALDLALDIILGRSPPHILGGQFDDVVRAANALDGWKRFDAKMAINRNMSERLFEGLDEYDAKIAAAQVLYTFSSVAAADELVTSLEHFGWDRERDLALSRSVGLVRENRIGETFEFFASTLPNNEPPDLIDALIERNFFVAALELIQGGAVYEGESERNYGLVGLARAAAEAGKYDIAREAANLLVQDAPDLQAKALKGIPYGMVLREAYFDAAAALIHEVPNEDSDWIRQVVAEKLLAEGQLRTAVEVINSAQDAKVLVEGYLAVGFSLLR